jgi:hypothetical protein
MKGESELLAHINEKKTEETRRVKHIEGDVQLSASVI